MSPLNTPDVKAFRKTKPQSPQKATQDTIRTIIQTTKHY